MKQSKKLLSLLLCAALLLSLVPVTGSASDYDDGCECYWCGHYHWGDCVCDECGACSDSCDNSDCYEVTHCTFCGACLCYVEHCIDGGLPACMDCLQSEGYHCADCAHQGLRVRRPRAGLVQGCRGMGRGKGRGHRQERYPLRSQ